MKKLLLAIILAALTPAGAGAFDVRPFEGNDTGGIVAWSPDAHRHRHDIAADHCARWNKLHRITSVHPRYGDYITFACYWPRGHDPRAFVLRRAY